MALEYEVRAEYQSMSLGQLLDATVTCFEGVGDTQNDILNRYFGITTVRQLANMPYFLWALGIQEQALKGGEASATPISRLSQSETLKFSISDHARGKTALDLLNSPVNVLDGLTPAQNLALYDSFRVTNVIQLAHNRIMLEARVIEYLEQHPELVKSGEGPEKDEIASILGAGTQVAASGDEAQGMLSRDKAPEGLREMAGELNEHLRGRIDALKDRAAERARDISSTTDMPSGDEISDSIESRRMSGSAASNRDEALRAIRERTESTRVQSVSPTGSDRTAALDAARGTGAGAATAGSGSPPGGQSASTESAGGAAATTEGAAQTTPGMAGATSDSLSTGPGMTVLPRGETGATEVGAQEGSGEEGAPAEGGMEAETAPAGFSFKPWMAAVAAGIVVVLGLILWLIPGGKDTAEQAGTVADGGESPATGQQAGAEGTPTQAGTETAATGQQSGTSATTAQPSQAGLGPQVRTIYTVVKGNSLWRISRRHYQNPLLWPKIYRANDDQIKNPDLIYPDQKLKIPELE